MGTGHALWILRHVQEDAVGDGKQFHSKRLVLARQAQGITSAELAQRLGVGLIKYMGYERGRGVPDETLQRNLGFALGVDPKFFGYQGPPTVSQADCNFRSSRGINQVRRAMSLARVQLACEFLEAMKRFGIRYPSSHQLDELRDRHWGKEGTVAIEEVAEDVRQTFGHGMGPQPAPITLFEAKGVFVFQLDGVALGSRTFSFHHRVGPVIVLTDACLSASRMRMEAAHEFGHFVLGHEDADSGLGRIEFQADRFARAFLLPRAVMYRELPKRLVINHILALKKRWRVPAATLVERGHELGIYSRSQYLRAMRTLRERFGMRDEPFEPEFNRPVLATKAREVLERKRGLSAQQVAKYMGLTGVWPDIERILGWREPAGGPRPLSVPLPEGLPWMLSSPAPSKPVLRLVETAPRDE